MGRNQRKKPYHRPRSRSAGTTRNYLETKAETGIEIPRIPASSAARRPIQLFPSYRTLEPSPPGGNLRFDCPLRRCWMEHLNSGIARFAPVFFNSPFTAADENLPLCMVRVKNKPQHLVFCSHFPHLLSKPRHLPVETSIQPCLSQVSGVRLASILGHREVPSRTPTPVLAPCLNPSPGELRHKAQDRCTSPALLFKLWTFGRFDSAFPPSALYPRRSALMHAHFGRALIAAPSLASSAGSSRSVAQTQIPVRNSG